MKISRLQVVIIDSIVPVVFAVCYILSRFMHSVLPLCYVREYSGFLCPACGGTRCVIAFTRFDFVESFFYNPYIFITIIVTALLLIFLNIIVFTKNNACKKIFSKVVKPRLVILWAIGFVAYGVIRNIV